MPRIIQRHKKTKRQPPQKRIKKVSFAARGRADHSFSNSNRRSSVLVELHPLRALRATSFFLSIIAVHPAINVWFCLALGISLSRLSTRASRHRERKPAAGQSLIAEATPDRSDQASWSDTVEEGRSESTRCPTGACCKAGRRSQASCRIAVTSQPAGRRQRPDPQRWNRREIRQAAASVRAARGPASEPRRQNGGAKREGLRKTIKISSPAALAGQPSVR